jgi:hypothetical protein
MSRQHEDAYEHGKRDERQWLQASLTEGDTPLEASVREAANIAEDLGLAQEGYEQATDDKSRDYWSRQIAYLEGQWSVLD